MDLDLDLRIEGLDLAGDGLVTSPIIICVIDNKWISNQQKTECSSLPILLDVLRTIRYCVFNVQ